MYDENEFLRLTKENDNFRKIIESQERTIKRLVDYFILRNQQVCEETRSARHG
jgi:hypothetical protein|uniref:adenylate kinase n=1 Tax=Roseburia sp. TaxID=2049040 RepID=UPI003FEFC15E